MHQKTFKIKVKFNVNLKNGLKIDRYSLPIMKAAIKQAVEHQTVFAQSKELDDDVYPTKIKITSKEIIKRR